MCAEGFQLQTTAGLTPGQLAAQWGVSVECVRKYRADCGMPSLGRDADGAYRFDFAVCDAWRKANKPTTLSGRPKGSGKKPSAGGERATQGHSDTATQEEQSLQRAADEAANAVSAGSVEEINELLREGKLSPTKVRNMQGAFSAALARVELDKATGTLIESKDATTAWGQALQTVKRELEGLPARTAARILTALGVPLSLEVQVRRLIEDEVVRICGRLAEGIEPRDVKTEAA